VLVIGIHSDKAEEGIEKEYIKAKQLPERIERRRRALVCTS